MSSNNRQILIISYRFFRNFVSKDSSSFVTPSKLRRSFNNHQQTFRKTLETLRFRQWWVEFFKKFSKISMKVSRNLKNSSETLVVSSGTMKSFTRRLLNNPYQGNFDAFWRLPEAFCSITKWKNGSENDTSHPLTAACLRFEL